MRAIPKWVEKIHEQNEKLPIFSTCFHPEGLQLIVGAGDKVLVYASDGKLLDSLKAHKDTVFCVSYAKDGKKFASGSADKTVIIWSFNLEGLLKYSHNEQIQCIAFNPVSHQLVSCSMSDFSIWSPEQKAVQKFKIGTKINCCCWTNDGQYLALGMANGVISIRNKAGEEKSKIERPGAAIYAMAWNPKSTADILCVVDWSQKMSFYSIGGQLIGKERVLGYDPLNVTFFPDGEFLVVAGCNKSVQLFTQDGIKLGTLGEHAAWIWTTSIHPHANALVVGCHNGSLAYYNLSFNTVHALFRDRYAFRENMCDVIIQHLISGQKVRIKCRDLVQKIAIFKNRLAVQLPERVVLYEIENQPMHYRVKEKIAKKIECSLLVVCSQNLVLCQDKRLQSLNFDGTLEREWVLDSFVRYIKVTGGSARRETLLVGLKNGQVWKIFLDNSLPILVTTVLAAVRCLDINTFRNKLAIVDEAGRLIVKDLQNDIILYQDSGVNSVAWNTNMDSMLCYSYSTGGLVLRVGNLPPKSPQTMTGVVVGLCGSTAFCLRGNVMSSIPLALGSTMSQFMESQMFHEAYEIACLGVPMTDWETLAQTALENMQFQVARDAYVKVRSLPWLELINELKERHKKGESKDALIGDVLALQGRFKEAAKAYQKGGSSSKALHMYSDLRLFDLAQEFAADSNKVELVKQRAEWACSVQEPRVAAQLLLEVNETAQAIEIIAKQGWTDLLFDVGRKTDDEEILHTIAEHLKSLGALHLATEVYKKMGKEDKIVQLHIKTQNWKEALKLTEHNEQMKQTVHLEHARWLVEKDQYLMAYEAFLSAGNAEEALKLLNSTIECAISEERFQDAGYYVWLKFKQLKDEKVKKLASIYYAYSTIHSYLREPFTSNPPLTLFHTSRFVANEVGLNETPPKGISLFVVYFTLSKQAKTLGATKLHLQANSKLLNLKCPPEIQEQVEVNFISSKSSSSGFNDSEDLLPMCYKCSSYSPHLYGNRCHNCQQDFIFSHVSFEILPLVEFSIQADINQDEAEKLLNAPPKREFHELQTDTMVNEEIGELTDAVDRETLRALDPRSVIIVKGTSETKYYRNLIPELQITICSECNQAFHLEDYELQVLTKGFCPFCRTVP